MKREILLVFYFCLIIHVAFAQNKALTAVKAVQAPKIDGNLDDAAWQNAPVATQFIQNFPSPGTPASAKTEVKLIYNDDAVYVAAYLYDDPALIRRQLTARDGEQQTDADYFAVFFDTYHDQQNGFQFLVTTANVQTDARLGGNSDLDFGEYGDKSWDAVWQSKTSVKEDGWVVEMRIPYISLRFAKKEVQTWGLQLLRYIRRNSESSFWNAVDPKQNGFVNQFGTYGELNNLQPPLRLSLSPYLSTGVRTTFINKKTNTEWLRNGGMDVKYGINESFTLDATLIPDFGQVISDNVENNLTPFEQKFTENRPFFTEGTELFNKAGLFYSRRVGATPFDYGQVRRLAGPNTNFEIRKNPAVTQLYNAIKLSGRTKKKLGIGIFNAVTAPTYADLYNTVTGKDTSIATEPLANYNIIVLDQAFKGRSYLTFTNTNVLRNGNNRDANVAALNFALFDKKNNYSLSGSALYSKTFGLTPYSSIFNTPYSFISTLDTVHVNSRNYAKPYDGFTTKLRAGKVSGKVQYYGDLSVQSDAYDPNDLGYLEAPNEVSYEAGISYNQFTPTDKFLTYNYRLTITNNWLYKPYTFSSLEIQANAVWVFKNMWDVYAFVGGQPVWQKDYFELRTRNKFVRKPSFMYGVVGGSTDSRKRLYLNYEVGFAKAPMPGSVYFSTKAGLRYRFSNKFTLGVQLDRELDKLQIGFAFEREPDGRPIIGFREYKDYTTILSGTYNFTPRMNLTLRARHYWSHVRYLSFHNVQEDGYYAQRAFIADQDQNFNLFNVDAFFTWDFRLGSRIIAGWKNALSGAEDIDGKKYATYTRNLGRTFALAHGNEVTLRIIYFLDYNQLRRKHQPRL